jgi:hypothetical protein
LFAIASSPPTPVIYQRRTEVPSSRTSGSSSRPGHAGHMAPYPMGTFYSRWTGRGHPVVSTRPSLEGTGRSGRRLAPNTSPLSYVRRIGSPDSQASVKLRLTLKTVRHAFLFLAGCSFSALRLPSGPLHQNRYSDRGVRPDEAPKPSTSASVPSSVDSLALTSHSRA